jgi:hypothetical protein
LNVFRTSTNQIPFRGGAGIRIQACVGHGDPEGVVEGINDGRGRRGVRQEQKSSPEKKARHKVFAALDNFAAVSWCSIAF